MCLDCIRGMNHRELQPPQLPPLEHPAAELDVASLENMIRGVKKNNILRRLSVKVGLTNGDGEDEFRTSRSYAR
jgi:hypothetical protein